MNIRYLLVILLLATSLPAVSQVQPGEVGYCVRAQDFSLITGVYSCATVQMNQGGQMPPQWQHTHAAAVAYFDNWLQANTDWALCVPPPESPSPRLTPGQNSASTTGMMATNGVTCNLPLNTNTLNVSGCRSDSPGGVCTEVETPQQPEPDPVCQARVGERWFTYTEPAGLPTELCDGGCITSRFASVRMTGGTFPPDTSGYVYTVTAYACDTVFDVNEADDDLSLVLVPDLFSSDAASTDDLMGQGDADVLCSEGEEYQLCLQRYSECGWVSSLGQGQGGGWVCPENVNYDGCNTVGGVVVCGGGVTTSPPAPDNGTPGVPASPDLSIEFGERTPYDHGSGEGGGSTTTVTHNIYSRTTIASSSSGALTGGALSQEGSPGGSPGGEGAGSVSGGLTCASPPVCSGDPVGCAQVRQQWEMRCHAEGLADGFGDDPFGVGFDDVAQGLGYGSHEDFLGITGESGSWIDELDVSELWDDTPPVDFGAGECVPDIELEIMGNMVVIPMSDMCDLWDLLGLLIVAGSSFIGMTIIIGGIRPRPYG